MKLPLLCAWACATLAALSVLAFDSSYESQALAAGYRRRASATPAIIGFGLCSVSSSAPPSFATLVLGRLPPRRNRRLHSQS
jgi:hypothetical protein